MKFLSLFLCLTSVSIFSVEGVKYTHITQPNSIYGTTITGAQSIHVIDIDANLCEIKPVKALDNGLGREDVLSLNTRHGSSASINGGFFSIGGTFDGKACGTLKIHDWFALPVKPRGCIGWTMRDQNPILDRLLVHVIGSYNNVDFAFSGLNRPRKDSEIVLFTPCFHKTTLTNPDGEELVVFDNVIHSIASKGSTKIPDNGFVVSIQKSHPLFQTFEIGMSLNVTTQIISIETSASQWESLDYIVGGTPLLLHNGNRIIDFFSEQTIPTFLFLKHARTAVGILSNNHWIFVVVDKSNGMEGMTMDELRELMEKLGCVHALNLDGGGSSTMVYENEIINAPQGDADEEANQKTARRVSDAIIVLPRSP